MRRLAAALAILALGCADFGDPPRDPAAQLGFPSLQYGVGSPEALPRLADDFYQRISNRRFNSIATYQDPALREYFRSLQSWSDYYAELVQALNDHAFEANRPTRIEVRAIAFEEVVPEPEDPEAEEPPEPPPALRAKVILRFTGENGRPLRFWRTTMDREDRWEQLDGRWWIVPGKL